jgi:hypothetical protein
MPTIDLTEEELAAITALIKRAIAAATISSATVCAKAPARRALRLFDHLLKIGDGHVLKDVVRMVSQARVAWASRRFEVEP